MLVVIVAPVILRLQWIDNPFCLENAVFVDILDLQSRHSLAFFGELRGTASFNRLFQYFSPSILPSVASFSINIVDLKRISDEISTIIWYDLCSRGQHILGTQRIHVSFGAELDSLRLRSLDIINIERIGGFIDMFTAIGNRLNKGRKPKVSRCGTLGYEYLRRSASNILLEER